MAEAAPVDNVAAAAKRFLTFRVDRRLYALAADAIVEVIRVPPAAHVPQAPPALIGIANLRGTVLPLVSLRGLLGLAQASGEQARAIVLDGTSPAALVVDSIEALVTVEAAKVESRQIELGAEADECLAGAFHADGLGTVKILDVNTLLDAAFATRRKDPAARRTVMAEAREDRLEAPQADVLVTFDVAGQEYALGLAAVQEIVPVPPSVTPMPRAEELVLGMMALRGQLLPLLSLRGLLGFAAAPLSDAREKVFVTAVGGAVVGLVADRARAIVSAERSLIDPVPAVLAARSGGEARIKAIYRGEDGKRLISILAPEQLFREDVMNRLGQGRHTPLQGEKMASAAHRQFLVFRLGADEFGLPVEAVDEVARVPDSITRLPKTPKFLEGVVNLRGEVLPVVDQRRRFDMPVLEASENRRLIVVRTEHHRAGLIVDSVSEVLRSSAIEPPPDLTGDITRLVHGVINLEDTGRIVLLLDPAELLTRAERGLLDSFESKAKAAK